MKIYVVLAGIDYEAFDTFMGAYSTRELAEKRASEIHWDEVRVEECIIDKAWDAL